MTFVYTCMWGCEIIRARPVFSFVLSDRPFTKTIELIVASAKTANQASPPLPLLILISLLLLSANFSSEVEASLQCTCLANRIIHVQSGGMQV
jgi:hypothetical protein